MKILMDNPVLFPHSSENCRVESYRVPNGRVKRSILPGLASLAELDPAPGQLRDGRVPGCVSRLLR